ncbi:unnamed protein product [Periconia digitata]|uniref:Uncharacterized protein n=1 Tax=Periconia digitata TaxID=1303443 RepID=A0A9W4XS42_9PLEO|nr:unnamed protein product [Periconia digitata]
MDRFKAECPSMSSVSGVFGNYLNRPSSTSSSSTASSSSFTEASTSSSSETSSTSSAQISAPPSSSPDTPAESTAQPPSTPSPQPSQNPAPSTNLGLGAPGPLQASPPAATSPVILPGLSSSMSSNSLSSSSTDYVPPPHDHSLTETDHQPTMSTQKIIGTTIGGTLGIALTICAVLYLLRLQHQKRRALLEEAITRNDNDIPNTSSNPHPKTRYYAPSCSPHNPAPTVAPWDIPGSRGGDDDKMPSSTNTIVPSTYKTTHPALNPNFKLPSSPPLPTSPIAEAEFPLTKALSRTPTGATDMSAQEPPRPMSASWPGLTELSGVSVGPVESSTTGVSELGGKGVKGGLESVAKMDDGKGS